jgi:translation initiation factor IF-2
LFLRKLPLNQYPEMDWRETMAQRKRLNAREALDLRRSTSAAHAFGSVQSAPKGHLEIVLKCDSFGTVEAVNTLIQSIKVPDAEIKVIYSGVGPISKSDLLMAMTGSKLVIGFNVTVMPKIDQWVKEHGAEIRLYNVIYSLAEDLKRIGKSFTQAEPEERITGKARVIALFKSSHRGIIAGCDVTEGALVAGKEFRIISAMGPVYTGRIESLHIEQDRVKEAKAGQQVGIKISDFSKIKVGDLLECFEGAVARKSTAWRPSGKTLRFDT